MDRLFFLFVVKLKKIIRFLFSYFTGGEECIICSQKVYDLPVCKACRSKYFNVEAQLKISRCNVCGKTLLASEGNCMRCRKERVLYHTDKVVPIFSYRLWNKEILFRWKILNVRSLSEYFSDLVAEALSLNNIKIIVPIPPRPGKIRENGWDQIDELCKFLKYKHNIQVLYLLKRNTKKQQKKLDRIGRLENIDLSYSMADEKKLRKELRDLQKDELEVCLIDDVATTGSTLEGCSKLLKNYGIKKVHAITIFSVD